MNLWNRLVLWWRGIKIDITKIDYEELIEKMDKVCRKCGSTSYKNAQLERDAKGLFVIYCSDCNPWKCKP